MVLSLALFVIIGVFPQAAAPAQTLSRGAVSGNVYTNADFGVTYTFPDGWKAEPQVDRGALDVRFTPPYPDGSDIEIFVLDSSLFPQVTPLRSFRKTDVALKYSLETHMREIAAGSRTFLRTDWSGRSGKTRLYQTRLFSDVGGWRLLLFFTAANKAKVESMLAGVAETGFQPKRSIAGPPGPHVMRVLTEDMINGKLAKKVQPRYPEEAKARHIQGQVLLEVVIGKDGKITSLVPLGGEPALVDAAIDAVRQWEYTPYIVDGEAVEVVTEVTVSFTIGG